MRATDAILLVGALLIALSFYRAHRDPNFAFSLFDLVMENGRLSRLAVAFVVTLIITSWIMVRLTLDGKLTFEYMAAYGTMWVAGVVAKMFGSNNPPATSLQSQEGNR